MKYLSPRISRLKSVLCLFLSFVILLSYALPGYLPVYAAPSPWTQTDWSGGSGQTSWSDTTRFDSSGSVDTDTAGEVTLTNTEELTNTEFETDLTGWTSSQFAHDDTPSIVAAYGMRRLRSAYSGNLLRLRRSSDNAESDFGYVANGDLDTASIAIWLGVSNGFVTTWYDQSGNARNLVQTTTDNQPLYVESGQNSKPILRLDGINDSLTPSSTLTHGAAASFFIVTTPTSGTEDYLIAGNASGSAPAIISRYSSRAFEWFNNSDRQTLATVHSGFAILTVAQTDNVSLVGRYNGTQQFSVVPDIIVSGKTIGRIGAAIATVNNTSSDMGEIMIASSAWDITQSQEVESAANTYWGVYSGSNDNESGSVTRDTSTFYAGIASAKVAAQTNFTFTQSVNVGDTNTYNLSTHAYTDGSAVTSADLELFYNGSTVSTTYTAAGGGWYKLTGTVTGANEARNYGVEVKSGKTVYVDDFSLNSYPTSGTLTSSIFDTEQGSNWGELTYNATAPTNTSVTVTARSSNSSNMSGAAAFSSCDTITSDSDMTANNCMTDNERYVQYQTILSTTDTSVTPTFSDISIAFTVSDADAPSIALTALSPDPTTDNTPTLTGTATDATGTVSSVEFQMDGTGGSWTACTASDGAFDEASEEFSCTVTSALSDGSHTMYVRATDSNGNTTAGGSESTDTFTVDTTAPLSFDLDSPGGNAYTNEDRPTFRWKAATDATSGLASYRLSIDNGDTGDFVIDVIPVSGTEDVETDRYTVSYSGFGDGDSSNNYISLRTKSHSSWGEGENDGLLKEGKRSWTVRATDNVGNSYSTSRTLFVDRTSPILEDTKINGFSLRSTLSFNTVDTTPTINGRLADNLSGVDYGQEQSDTGPKVASGPKRVEIKVEKRNVFGLYSLHSLTNLNLTDIYWLHDGTKIEDNSLQESSKYSDFNYSLPEELTFGEYRIYYCWR